jgi:hypothetical protein
MGDSSKPRNKANRETGTLPTGSHVARIWHQRYGRTPIDGCSFDTLARATKFAREMFAIRIDHDMVEPTLRVFDCKERTFLCWRRALQIPRLN